MRRWLMLTKALLLMQLRNKMTLFWNLFFPLSLLMIYTLIFGQAQMGGASYVTWILPGVIVLNAICGRLPSSRRIRWSIKRA